MRVIKKKRRIAKNSAGERQTDRDRDRDRETPERETEKETREKEGVTGLKRCVFGQEADQKTGTKCSRRKACVYQHFMVPKRRVFRTVTAESGRVEGVTGLKSDALRVSRACNWT